jgi:hypothetical protein
MSVDWYAGIREACVFWLNAETLQETFQALEESVRLGNDAVVDAAKGIVECVCRIIIDELDKPESPIKPQKDDTPITEWLGIATRLLGLSEIRHRSFANLIKFHNNIAESVRVCRNDVGLLSHGRDGFIEKLTEYHHRVVVLSADAIVTFLHKAYLGLEPDLLRTRQPYERFEHLNQLIDSRVSMDSEIEENGSLKLNIYLPLPSSEVLTLYVEASQLLYYLDRAGYVEALRVVREDEQAK